MSKLVFLGAHPDDETFMAGATLAKYAELGHKISVICATKGESGQWSDVDPNGKELAEVREAEHRKGLKKLGIEDINYLGHMDGFIANKDIGKLTESVTKIVKEMGAEVLITPDINGISGHMDHMAMALVGAYVYAQVKSLKKLYYYVEIQDEPDLEKREYWGRESGEVTTMVDIEEWRDKAIEAAMCHKTQNKDVERLIPYWRQKIYDNFILMGHRVEVTIPETDLLAGI